MPPITKKELARRVALETDDSKYCAKCKQVKPLYEFPISSTQRKMSHCWCLDCTALDDRKQGYKKRHDITLEEYEEKLEQQNNKCAICGTIVPGGRHNVFCVDHDHDPTIKNKKDAIRSLLCADCNVGLGSFKDDPEILTAAAGYLLRWRAKKEKKCTLKTGEKNEEN